MPVIFSHFSLPKTVWTILRNLYLGAFVKAYFFVLGLTLLSLSAFADRGDDHFKELCLSPETQATTGSSGTCNLVMSASKKFPKGICSGMLMDQIPCTVIFDTSPGESVTGMRVICGEVAKPLLDQKLDITSSVYQVSALIRSAEGKPSIKKDPNIYATVQSALIYMLVAETPAQEKMAMMAFILNDTVNMITGVTCE